MASGFQVELVGMARLRKTMRAAGLNLADLKTANAKAAAMVAAAGRSSAPRKTGRLSGTVRGNRAVGRAVVQAGNARVPYASIVHYGWPQRDIDAQPWLAEAAVDTQPQWLPAYEADIKEILSQVKGA